MRAYGPGKLALIVLGCSLLTAAATSVRAERLPVKTYTTADGLAHNVVHKVVRDSRGFLWFCTREGLSRFDGYSFSNYGVEHGLPSAVVNDLLETREGVYWVGTGGGLCRFNPQGGAAASAMFAAYFPGEDAKSKYVTSLLQDRSGALWCGTHDGLYRVETTDGAVKCAFVDLGIPDYLEARVIHCLLEDRSGALWVGAASGLYRHWPDGRTEAYTTREGLPDNIIRSLLEDREGRLWVGTTFGGLCRLVPDPASHRPVAARVYSIKDGLPTLWINQLFQAADGSLWAGSTAGLIQFLPTADGRDFRFRAYRRSHGLSYEEVGSLAEDRSDNLWLGILNGGAAKIARSGLTTFGEADGFVWSSAIFETLAGDLIVVGASEGGWSLNRLDGEKFTAIFPTFPKSFNYGWGWNQTALEDHTGEWWIATGIGVFRFPKVSRLEHLALTPPKAVYTTRDGLAANSILRLFEDARGDIWIGAVGEGKSLHGLSRWERQTGAFHHYTEKNGLPRLDTFYVSSFAEDRAGNLWIGFSGSGGLARYRGGRFTLFTSSYGIPAGSIRNLFVDAQGRLWMASYRGGLLRMDNPEAERPALVTFTTAQGLSSNETNCITEDHRGRVYVSTGRGIDRLDPATGRIKHYATTEGVPLGEMRAAFCDRRGTLWFSSDVGLVRLVPEPDPPPLPPPIHITGLRIAGEAQRLSGLGETSVALPELAAGQNHLQIDFVALGFGPGEGLRYQYKLEGAGQDWSPLAEQRAVNFANLAPGRYRFLARAVNADGVPSAEPAMVTFRILPPIWQRWWFLTLAAALLGLAAYALYRYRLDRLLEIERVRTRIAADLHDDIGANLTKIAILSEVAHQQLGSNGQPDGGPLAAIAHISRESVAAMSDIVWAINPKKDRLRDLTRRMRGFASDIFTSRDIGFRFHAPDGEQDVRLGPDARRDVFLIFKEAVNNLVRHSGCERAEIEVKVEGAWLVVRVSDDGSGFDAAQAGDGNGLVSIRRRAQSLGGELDIASQNGQGTTVTLRVPTGQAGWL